jgi:hypothetical protein
MNINRRGLFAAVLSLAIVTRTRTWIKRTTTLIQACKPEDAALISHFTVRNEFLEMLVFVPISNEIHVKG